MVPSAALYIRVEMLPRTGSLEAPPGDTGDFLAVCLMGRPSHPHQHPSEQRLLPLLCIQQDHSIHHSTFPRAFLQVLCSHLISACISKLSLATQREKQKVIKCHWMCFSWSWQQKPGAEQEAPVPLEGDQICSPRVALECYSSISPGMLWTQWTQLELKDDWEKKIK